MKIFFLASISLLFFFQMAFAHNKSKKGEFAENILELYDGKN